MPNESDNAPRLSREPLVGTPQRRVDGALKVTGRATYAAEYAVEGLLHGVVVGSAISKGRIVSMNDASVRGMPGVVEVFTHRNRPRTTAFHFKFRDTASPPGKPLRPLHDAHIAFHGEPVALVVADTLENARDAASALQVSYETEAATTELRAALDEASTPSSSRFFVPAPPAHRGDFAAALRGAAFTVDIATEDAGQYHNPMELFATTVEWHGDGQVTVYDKTQGSQNVSYYLRTVFGLSLRKTRVVNAYVGGAFGSGLRPQYSLFLAVTAAKALKRSVRVEISRAQMFTIGHRPPTVQRVQLGADSKGRLLAMAHKAVAATSQYEEHQDTVVNWSGLLYRCDNTKFEYELARLDTETPSDMRAPGAATGSFAIETAMDELAERVRVDPVALRLTNYTTRDDYADKDFSSKALKECYAEGAARFGWSARVSAPRSVRDGTELIGYGMAGGMWDARMAPAPTRARATMFPDGHVEVESSTADIGTGTYTVLAQLAADALGLPLDRIVVKLGDSRLPLAQVEGASWTAASTGSAVQKVCDKLAKKRRGHKGPLLESLSLTATVIPDIIAGRKKIAYTHSAVFVEVRVDEELGVVRVARVVSAIAAGRILNPATAASQIKGGVVMAIGQALHEEPQFDHRSGRLMNRSLADYHIPCNADIDDLDVIFVNEEDSFSSPIGVKGVGEIGGIGVAAAIANAIYNATGVRVRSLPIKIENFTGPAPTD